jgi:pentatricopeptide repeat protein
MIDLQPNNAEAYYNVACIYSRQKKVDEAIDWLNKAIERGFNNWNLMKSDNDLANIRQSLYYQNMIKNH